MRLVLLLLMVWITPALAEGPQDIVLPFEAAVTETKPPMPEPGLDERPVLSIAVMAIRGPETALNMWQATADHLTEHVPGYRFVIEPLDFDSIRQAVADRSVSFVLTNPGMYVEFEALHGVRRIATLKNLRLGRPYTEFGAVIFRRADRTDIKDIHGLRGKRFATVNETAFGGWHMALRQMLEMGFDPYRKLGELYSVGTHDKVVYEVLEGRADAGTVRTDTLERMEQEGSIRASDFALIHENTQHADRFPFALSTRLYPEWPFAILPDTPQELAEQVAIVLMGIPPESAAARDGRYQGWTVPGNYQPVHDTLRMLRVAPYEAYGEVTWQGVLQKYWPALLGILLSLLLLTLAVARFRSLNLRLSHTQRQLQGELAERRRAEEDLRAAGESLREADRRKDVFLATLAHELRNPLAPLTHAVEILKRQDNEVDQPSVLLMIERQLGHLVRLIDDLLDVSRISQGKLQLHRQPVALSEIVEQALEASRPHLHRAGQALTVTLPPHPVFLDADPVRLAQVFLNLLNNASKYTEPGGQIRLSATREADEVVVTVADTGIGIPREHLPHLFEMFSQGDPLPGFDQQGLGIGLGLARELVVMHGGHIEARSDGRGRGSEFIVRFPILIETKADDGAPAADPEPCQKPGSLRPRRILVVDDNADAAHALALFLRISGHEVEMAHDGLEAVAGAERHRPEVVLLDIGMPRLDGYGACRRIREQPWGKTMVIVALTGWGQEEDQLKTREAGFDAHLVKPVNGATLLATLAGLDARGG
jgi:signal transduction histidine kinase